MSLFDSNTWTSADEMNLYLTWKGLKPASIIDLYLGNEDQGKKINKAEIEKAKLINDLSCEPILDRLLKVLLELVIRCSSRGRHPKHGLVKLPHLSPTIH